MHSTVIVEVLLDESSGETSQSPNFFIRSFAQIQIYTFICRFETGCEKVKTRTITFPIILYASI
jgi:hypothetical protein